jgi:protein Tex
MTNLQYIAAQVTAPQKSIEATLQLLSEDCTIPFIARYRKDKTGNPPKQKKSAIRRTYLL